MSRAVALALVAGSLLGALGCTGRIGGGSNDGAGGLSSNVGAGNGAGAGAGVGVGAGGTMGSGITSVPGDPLAAGLLPLRRLTSREYLNTVRDLLADTSLGATDVPTETDATGNNVFPFRQPDAIGVVDAKSLETAAEQVAKNLVPQLASVLPCNPTQASAEAACATQFINTFGLKIYRRPLTVAEAADLTALYQTGRTTLALDFKGSIDLLVEAMLQAPGFLYHWELDPGSSVLDGKVVQLGSYQVANRLSYLLWGSMPDAALFAAAASGSLATSAGVETQARRMLQDTKTKDGIADFFDDWLDINTLATRPKDPAFYPQWNETLAAEMETEVRDFATSTVLGSGLFNDVLAGTKSSVNQTLAAVYGLSGVMGSTPQAVTFNASQRSGLFTLAGFLTVNGASNGSSPVRRGHAVYTRLLCHTLPDPPANVPPPAAPTPGLTTRQRFVTHDQNACTGSCHNAMDPIGFGFEHYDGIGQYRTTDQNLPVDASGTIDLDGKTQTFSDGIALTQLLAASAEVQTCFTAQWLRYAANRWDSSDDAASIQAAAAKFASSNLDVREMLVALVTSRTFRYRAPAAGETLQ